MKKLYTAKQMQWREVKNSILRGAMKDLLGKDRIAKALDKPQEKKEFYDQLKTSGENGVTPKDMRKVLGHFRAGKGKEISKSEAMQIAGEIFKTGKRYEFASEPKEEPTVKRKARFSYFMKSKKISPQLGNRFSVGASRGESPQERNLNMKVANPVTSLGAAKLDSQMARRTGSIARPSLGMSSKMASSRIPLTRI